MVKNSIPYSINQNKLHNVLSLITVIIFIAQLIKQVLISHKENVNITIYSIT